MSISIYLILLVVLLIFNLVFWLLVIWFRILFNCDLGIGCCSDTESTADSASTSEAGLRNLGFIDDDPLTTRQAPFSIMEAMESPPSYEDALKYDQFGFQSIPTVHTASSSRSQESSHHQNSHSSPGERLSQMSQSPPRVTDVRSRSSTTLSSSPLDPIREEEDDVMPVTVVIDCIGVQASRLVPNCDTKVEISDGEQLHNHSKC